MSIDPILKYAGGKTQLLAALLPKFPERVETYYEPFVGGGAVFFALAFEGRFKRAVISDASAPLVEVYQSVRDSIATLLARLRVHQRHARSERYFYQVRSQDPRELSKADRAARLIFLNRTCFRGLMRYNRAGEFNCPFGHYRKPDVVREEQMRLAWRALRTVEIRCCDFSEAAFKAGQGDAIYFDPPYAPASDTASFTAYTAERFGVEDHARLFIEFARAARNGARAVLSAAGGWFGAAALRADGYAVEEVDAARAVNPKKRSRPTARELIVSSREHLRVRVKKAG